MKHTVEMIENLLIHLNQILADPQSDAKAKEAARNLLEHLKEDLEVARAAANRT